MNPGDVFARLTAVEASIVKGKWVFDCQCGNRKVIGKYSVSRGLVRSCGCLHLERCKSGANARRHGEARVGAVSRLHSVWRGMLNRCNPANKWSERYGKRGIAVCPEWQEFEPFAEWARSNGYRDDLTIDRADNNGDYEPANCRWVDMTAQCRNRRTSRFLTVAGETKTIAEWAEIRGIRQGMIQLRLRRGWDAERAVIAPAIKPTDQRRNREQRP